MNTVRHGLFKLKLPKCLVNPSRSVNLWNKDWMPGPYPETQAQREAAAKKYNLLPEEYEPDPDGQGDYPKLPDISGDSKCNYRDWDIPALKKDFNEPMHAMANLISEDRWDINHIEKQQLHPLKQMGIYFGVLLFFFTSVWLVNDHKLSLPHMKKQYPADGTHYKYP